MQFTIQALKRARAMEELSVVVNVPCVTGSDQGPRNSPRQTARCAPVVSHSFEHHTGDSTFYSLTTLLKISERAPWGDQVPSISPLPPPTSRDDLWLNDYLDYPHAAKAL
ncbi:hypothetical protein TNCV_2732751 [Trichonephila clavipes]|nr:hypothetical protein TNCV_2732751 [Trichonephila clavipes]